MTTRSARREVKFRRRISRSWAFLLFFRIRTFQWGNYRSEGRRVQNERIHGKSIVCGSVNRRYT